MPQNGALTARQFSEAVFGGAHLPRTMQAKDSNPGCAREFHLSHCGYGIIHIQQLNTTYQCNETQGDTSPHLKEGAFIPATLQNFSTFPEGTHRR